MENDKCKKCKRSAEKLFLKGERCYSAKCPISKQQTVKKRFSKGRKKTLSEFALQLRDKQRVKFTYGLREKQFKNYVMEAQDKVGANVPSSLFGFLESRLDNVVYRIGFADSRKKARQITTHGHIYVNGKKLNIPSYRVKAGDIVSIRTNSAEKGIFKDLDIKLKKYNAPAWINLDKTKKEGVIAGVPVVDTDMEVNLNSIVGFYSR